MQRDRFAVARRWLRGATTDMTIAADLAEKYPSRAAFHAQQAAEMGFKAVLVAATDDHPTTHASSQLVRELRALPFDVPEDVARAASSLDMYYLVSRYPDAAGDADPLDLVSAEDIALALDRARRVLAFASASVDGLERSHS